MPLACLRVTLREVPFNFAGMTHRTNANLQSAFDGLWVALVILAFAACGFCGAVAAKGGEPDSALKPYRQTIEKNGIRINFEVAHIGVLDGRENRFEKVIRYYSDSPSTTRRRTRRFREFSRLPGWTLDEMMKSRLPTRAKSRRRNTSRAALSLRLTLT